MSPRKITMWFTDGVIAGTAAAVLSGIPSTLHALLSGGNVYAAWWAAGGIVAGRSGGFARGMLAKPRWMCIMS